MDRHCCQARLLPRIEATSSGRLLFWRFGREQTIADDDALSEGGTHGKDRRTHLRRSVYFQAGYRWCAGDCEHGQILICGKLHDRID